MTVSVSNTPTTENQLIKEVSTIIAGKTVNAIDARSLHEFLESKQSFSNWINAKVVDSPFFDENVDYIVLSNIIQNPSGGRPQKNYALTPNTAKKVSMVEQTPRGDEARDYFLEMERVAMGISNTPGSQKPITHKIAANLEATLKVANMFGLKGNQALLSANKSIERSMGINCMASLNVTHLIAEKQVQYFTPSVLGKPLGMSAQKVNKALESLGLQAAVRDHRNKVIWQVTEAGKGYCQLLDTNKKRSDGTPVMQVKWAQSVMERVAV